MAFINYIAIIYFIENLEKDNNDMTLGIRIMVLIPVFLCALFNFYLQFVVMEINYQTVFLKFFENTLFPY